MPHLLIEEISSATGNFERESTFNGPAVETVNARLEQLGAYRDDTIGANDAASAMKLGAVDAAAPVDTVAGRAGKIVGLVVRAVSTTTIGPIAAGTMTFRSTVGGVAAGDAAVLSSTVSLAETTFATPVAFVAGDLLGISMASASLSPTTSRAHAWLLIRWTAIG